MAALWLSYQPLTEDKYTWWDRLSETSYNSQKEYCIVAWTQASWDETERAHTCGENKNLSIYLFSKLFVYVFIYYFVGLWFVYL